MCDLAASPRPTVLNHFVSQIFRRKHGVDASNDTRAIQKLRREVERAKRALSTQQQVHRTERVRAPRFRVAAQQRRTPRA